MKSSIKKFIAAFRIVLCLELIVVTVLSLIPNYTVPSVIVFWDKAQHSIEFFVLVLTGCLAYPRTTVPVVTGLMMYGALIELAQSSLTTTRVGDISDFFADVVGILLGRAVYFLLVRFGRSRINPKMQSV
jgi:VanZ family protein